MSDRLADTITALVERRAGAVLRFGTHLGGGQVDVGGGQIVEVTAWAGSVPPTNSRAALIVQRGTCLGIGVI